MEVMQKVAYEFAKSIGGVIVARQLDLASKLDFGNSFVMVHGTNGVIYFLMSDLINYLSYNQSKILNGDYMGILDDSVFFGALSGGTEATSLDAKVADLLKKTVLSDTKQIAIAVDSAVLTAGRVLASYIDATPQVPEMMKTIRHPTKLFNTKK